MTRTKSSKNTESPEGPYVALIGDVRRSRDLADRSGAQARLQDLLDKMNERHRDVMLAPLALTGGDEFKALLVDAPQSIEIAWHLGLEAYPLRLRFGIGRGGLDTDLRPSVGALDGPAFHHARAAIDDARHADAWLRLVGFPGPERLYDAAQLLIGRLLDRWTARQWEHVAMYEASPTQQEAARRLGVSKAAVSQALKAAQHQEIRALFDEVRNAIWPRSDA